MPWARFEPSERHLADNRNAIAPVQGNGSGGEHTNDGCVGTETDQIDSDATKHTDPYRVEWRLRPGVDLDPDTGKGDEAISREGEQGAPKGLLGPPRQLKFESRIKAGGTHHAGKSHEFDDEKGANCIEDSSGLSEHVVEYLRDWLFHRTIQD